MPRVETQKKPAEVAESPPSVWDMTGTRILIYGDSGTGKSRTAGTFPGPTLWLLCSGGKRPGELKSVDTPDNRKKITPRIISSSSQMRGYLNEARNYETTVLDHASGLADLLLKEILGLDELPAQKSWGMATQQNYGQQSSQAKEIFRTLLNLPGNVVFIAQQRSFGGKDEGFDAEMVKPVIGPSMTPSMASWLCPAVDYVVQTFKRKQIIIVRNEIAGQVVEIPTRTGKTDFCLRTGPSEAFLTKFRVPEGIELPDFIVDPSYAKIQKIIDGSYWSGPREG